jgi:hypothetical protein
MPEPVLLTETEWRVREAKRECATYGHDWQVTYTVSGQPISMSCERPCDVGAFKITPFKES